MIKNIFKKVQKTTQIVAFGGLIIHGGKFCAQLAKKDIAMVDRIIAKTEVAAKKHRNILVIDNFANKSSIDIDADFIGDVGHGFVTSKIIENGLDSVNVFKKNIDTYRTYYGLLMDKIKGEEKVGKSFIDVLNEVLAESATAKKYDAINLSAGISIDFEKLSKSLGIEITPENIKTLSKEIKIRLKTPKEDIYIDGQSLSIIGQVIDRMDSISAKGTQFYISAGNDGRNNINLFNLVDSAFNVGALEKNGKKADFSCDNSLVNRWEISDLNRKKTDKGFDITGHGKTDVHYDEVTFFHKETFDGFHQMPLQGTSFSAPKALVRDFTNRIF